MTGLRPEPEHFPFIYRPHSYYILIFRKCWRALGATDAAKSGENRTDIQKRLAHTSAKTTDIYIKAVVPEKSELESKLPW